MSFLKWLMGKPNLNETSSANEEISGQEVDPYNPFLEPIQLPLTDIIDLHTIPPRDVKRAVEEYLREAYEAEFRVLRIVHGKGVGIQREIVRTILERTEFVGRWTDAPPEAGGLGATIVFLNRKTTESQPE